MCGIVGFITKKSLPADTLQQDINQMNQTLAHRGPNGANVWLDAEAGIALGHRRLSIMDLSPTGQQPMISQCGRWVICYNGETYSQRELTPILSSHGLTLRGHSDTELMVEACAVLGPLKAIEYFIGMFAFALWDRREQILYLVRDRLGIKPLYWTYQNQGLFFSSELKALKANPNIRFDIDRKALAGYLKRGYIAAPHTIYQHIYKLLPGHILSFHMGSQPQIKPYWSLKTVIQEGRSHSFPYSPAQAVEDAETLINDAVKRRMIADVPLGAFLSGGIDSSLVVSLMQAQSLQPIKTFTLGFHEKSYDEANQARQIAAHLGTDHTDLYVTPQQAQAIIPLLPSIYDEPFADASQIPTLLVSQLARQHVTVALSGDGGDETFGGYNRYAFLEKIKRYHHWLPGLSLGGKILSKISPTQWQHLERFLPTAYRHLHLAERGEKIARLFATTKLEELYSVLVNQWPRPEDLLPDTQTYPDNLWTEANFLSTFTDKMRYVDTISYLADDILVKLDRATMAVGLEARVPLLDHRLVAWAWQQPYTIHQGQTKWLLRQILKAYVPEKIFHKPKMGFSVPIGRWLRHDLKDWANDLLSVSKLKETFVTEPIQQRWQQHLKGHAHHSQQLWNILMYQAWHASHHP